MTPFGELTGAGRLRRLRRVAAAALAHYALGECRLSLVADSFNTLFRVTAEGGSFVLRVGPRQRIHRAGAARAEAEWTGSLAARGLPVPRVIAAGDGSASVTVSSPGVPGPRECALLSWTPGHRLRRPVGAREARDLGRLCARFHAVPADRARLPAGVLDGRSALLFDIPNRLGELSAGYGSLFGGALTAAQDAIDKLWRSAARPPRLLHGDLTPANVLRTRRGLAAVDFQDMAWGHEEQDLAHTMFGLSRDDAGTGAITGAFRAGYEEIRPWPELDRALLAGLFAARRLTMVNLALSLRRPGLSDYVAHHAAALRDYLGPAEGVRPSR